MLRRLSISNRRVYAAVLVAALSLGIGHGWAQQTTRTPFEDDLFAAYHNSLTSTADKVLAAPVQPSIESLGINSASPAAPIEAAIGKVSVRAGAIGRVQELRPVIEPILREEHVPTELAAVVLIESGGQPTALSRKGALGIWQFMPDTARRYGLTVTSEHDERLDVRKSTRAAAHYLRDLHVQFGDWQLAFAAYNAGGEAVQRAMERNGAKDFTALSGRRLLPLETRKYVPAVLEAVRVFDNAGSGVVRASDVNATWILYAESQLATGGNR